MTLRHLSLLYFAGHDEAAKKRVQKLGVGRYVAQRTRRPYERAVFFLTKKAFRTLHDGGHLSDFPRTEWARLEKRIRVSPLTLAHELAVMDVKAALVSAVAAAPAATVQQFTTWPRLCQFHARPTAAAPDVLVKPDGFLRIRERMPDGNVTDHHFFLELDRSTETQGRLALHASCYRDYYRRGGFAARMGAGISDRDQFPFRVLMIFENAERRNNAAEHLLLLRPPILAQVWLTTLAEVTANALGAIWVRPIDYRRAVAAAGVSSPAASPSATFYRRSVEREALVERTVAKHALLGSSQPFQAQLGDASPHAR